MHSVLLKQNIIPKNCGESKGELLSPITRCHNENKRPRESPTDFNHAHYSYIFICLRRILKNFFDNINGKHPSMKFTLETETICLHPFLGIIMSRNENAFDGKPTQPDYLVRFLHPLVRP